MLKLGVIGTGAIASQFIKEAKENKNIEVVAVAARNFEKTKRFAKDWDINKAFADVSRLLEDDEVEAVYVATLHPTHAMYSRLALLAGKHVLCEKPAAIKPWQLEELISIAKQNNKLFMEAMTVGFHPLYQEIKSVISAGEIGELTHVESTFGKISAKEHKHTAELAGGCIYDIGIYNLFLIIDLLGMPEEISVQMRKHRNWDVPGSVQMLAKHRNNTQSYSFMTMDAISTTMATFIGTEGTIVLPHSWTVPHEYKIYKRDGTIVEKQLKETKWLGYELQEFFELIQAGKIESAIMTHQKSLELQQMIEQIYNQLNLVVPDEAIII